MTKVSAESLEELAHKLDDVDPEAALAEISAYNGAVDRAVPFNPNIKDGRCTRGLAVPKSNWANPIDEPPFMAFAVTCGITFTFGGLRITREGEVVDTGANPIPGLYADRRTGRRPLLLQLRRRHRPNVRRSIRQTGRHKRRIVCQPVIFRIPSPYLRRG